MPELLEVEYYRRLAFAALPGRHITEVHTPDSGYLRGGISAAELTAALRGRVVSDVRRHGKLLLIDLNGGASLGLRFGMTGRLVVDGVAAIDKLEYASGRDEPAWERFALGFAGGGRLVMVDPRRLGGVQLDPPFGDLGPDAATIGPAGLRRSLGASRSPLKARLMDQSVLAGLGNLLADEILWRARLDPRRRASGLAAHEVRRLHAALRVTLAELDDRGGSHTGDLFPQRGPAGSCPRCGEVLSRAKVGGRTTFWCPGEQR